MSEIKEFFRHCPSCGRRFHIKLVSKEEIGEKKVTEYVAPEQVGTGLIYASEKETPLEGDAPIYVDVKEFQYTYKCTHCGHQWSEVRDKEKASRV
jgi:DNA-directed RNA polymerase subunit RPC12/RpoP